MWRVVRADVECGCRIKISRLPAYQKVLTLGRERDNAILLDIGCCCEDFYISMTCFLERLTSESVGNDTRKVIADGFPAKRVLASDIQKGTRSSVTIKLPDD